MLSISDLTLCDLLVDVAQALPPKNGSKEGKIIEASTVTVTVMQNHSIRETYLGLFFIVDADQR
jgi:hypothetical protein